MSVRRLAFFKHFRVCTKALSVKSTYIVDLNGINGKVVGVLYVSIRALKAKKVGRSIILPKVQTTLAFAGVITGERDAASELQVLPLLKLSPTSKVIDRDSRTSG